MKDSAAPTILRAPEARAGLDDFNAGLQPALDTDLASRLAAAEDFGHIVHRMPSGVARPQSAEEVADIVRYARARGIRTAVKGGGFNSFGLCQVQDGIVIDMSSMRRVVSIAADHAIVEAGITWRELLIAAMAHGLTPPVLTDYTGLTVGGTLSIGGIGGGSYRHGAQVDTVEYLEVVTGTGELQRCSLKHNRALFHAALAGLGFCAVIVRAKIRLVPAKRMATTHRLMYANLPTMFADLRSLIEAQQFDHLRGHCERRGDRFVQYIEATCFHDGEADRIAPPATGLQPITIEPVSPRSYFEYTDLVHQSTLSIQAAGLGRHPHPWIEFVMPDSQVEAFATRVVSALDPKQFLPGSLVLFYPLVRKTLTCPLLAAPDASRMFSCDILRTIPPDEGVIRRTLDLNRQFYDLCSGMGGKFYPNSAVRLSRRDWQRHFGAQWAPLMAAKQRFDPSKILGRGPFLSTLE